MITYALCYLCSPYVLVSCIVFSLLYILALVLAIYHFCSALVIAILIALIIAIVDSCSLALISFLMHL
jgi:hypothetical protein